MSEVENQSNVPAREQMAEVRPNTTVAEEEKFMRTISREITSDLEMSIDEVSYPIGEVPQAFLLDPEVTLALNSERLSQKEGYVQNLVEEVDTMIKEEIAQIQKLQKNVDQWEMRIERNKAFLEKNRAQAKQNIQEIVYDKKNREYWLGRAEQVLLDYNNAALSNREDVWSWLIKKYGLKNADGSSIDSRNRCVDELCNGEINNLASEYKNAAERYEQGKRYKEQENLKLNQENAKLKNTIEILQKYIHSTYTYKVEPLQDGVLLLKELSSKLKSLMVQEQATFGDLREWAEEFLNEYLQENPRTHQSVVSDFRRISSIPLPPEFS